MILIILLYALLALTFPLAQYAITFADPFFLIACRMLVAGSCLIGYHCLVSRQTVAIKKEDRWHFVKACFFHIYLAFIPEFWALQYLSALKINLIYCSTPFISALLERILHRKKLGCYKIAGMALGFMGMVPLFFFISSQAGGIQSQKLAFLPEIVLLIAVISAAYAWLLVKDLLLKGYTLPLVNGVAMIGGGAMSLATALLMGTTSTFIIDMKPFLIATGTLIVLSNVVVYNLYGMLLKRYSLTFISLAGFLCPVFGAMYAWLFFGEHISWHYLLALCFLMSGLVVFHKVE